MLLESAAARTASLSGLVWSRASDELEVEGFHLHIPPPLTMAFAAQQMPSSDQLAAVAREWWHLPYESQQSGTTCAAGLLMMDKADR